MSLAVGTVLAPLTKPPITEGQLREYADASLDRNPIHLDPAFAREAGFPSVIAHGMISMAFLGDYVHFHFSESRYKLVRLKTRFRKVIFPGESLTCEGRVKEVAADGTVIVSLSTRTHSGEISADGEARLRPH